MKFYLRRFFDIYQINCLFYVKTVEKMKNKSDKDAKAFLSDLFFSFSIEG